MPNIHITRVLSLISLALLVSCGGAPPAPMTPIGVVHPEKLFPLVRGAVWSHRVRLAPRKPTELILLRVKAQDGERFVLGTDGSEDVTVVERVFEGLYLPELDRWLLRMPIEVGAEWPSRVGVAQVVSVTESIETPAGKFEACVRIREIAEWRALSAVTIYCPGVGPVWIQVSEQAEGEALPASITSELLGWSL